MPVLSSVSPVVMQAVVDQLLATLVAAPPTPITPAPVVRLFTAGPAPITPGAVAADFTEATFTGYMEQALVIGASLVNLPSGLGRGAEGSVNFVCSGSATPNIVLGYYVFDAATNAVIAEYFETPVSITVNGDFIALAVLVPIAFAVEVA